MNLTEIILNKDEHFLTIKETLERIGLGTQSEFIPSCYILHKRGQYFIAHWKEMANLDGDDEEVTDDDLCVKFMVINLLAQWALCEPINSPYKNNHINLKVIKHSDKQKWNIFHQYDIGNT